MPFCSCYRRVGPLLDPDLCCLCVGTGDFYNQGYATRIWVSLQPRQGRVVIFRCTTAGAMRILSLRGAASLPPAGSQQMRLLPCPGAALEGVRVRVSKDDTICGLAAPAARQLVRAYFDDRPVEVACDILGVSQDAARDQMRAFEAAGYVERGGLARGAGDDWWATTVKGNALANASFGKPISRATATRLLGQVIERARAYNADPARLLTVTEIVVFGSYLDPVVDLLGDLDLAVSTVRRDTDGQRYVDQVLEYARVSGRSFSAFHDRLFWPARELRMILKNRSPAISITDEDIRKLTERIEIVYVVADDPEAIPPPADAVAGA